MIKGVFTLNWDTFKKGLKQGVEALKNTFVDPIAQSLDGFGEILDAGATVAVKTYAKALNREVTGTKIDLISPDDIQGGVDSLVNMGKEGFEKLKSFFEGGGSKLDFTNMFSEGGDGGSGSGSGSGGGAGGSGGGGADVKAIEKQKSAMRIALEGMSNGWKTYFASQDAAWTNWGEKTAGVMLEVAAFASDIGNQISALSAQRHENKMTELSNEQASEMAALQNRGLSEKEFAKEKEKIDKRYAAKKKDLEIKQAKREKKMAIFQAIIKTAAGVAKAIPNPYLMAFAGIMGALQVSAIASAPIPMAKGALAFSPTNAIVGDNVNAKNDPEIIAPLSKLSAILGNQNNNVNVTGTISGNDVVLSSSKANISLARYA